ncbi:MAG: tributyrin esterase [Methanosarcinales archaeon]|nr:tributyrin esterase [Methanosarcinales archaeon]
MMEIEACQESCICDFTFDFYWQHQGSRLDPEAKVGGQSYQALVEALRRGETVHIKGDAGGRLGSSLGVDLVRFGGSGGPLEVGSVVVDGDVGSRMGISMLRGSIYISGQAELPLGNVVEVDSDRSGYRRFVSVTEALERQMEVQAPNCMGEGGLDLADGLLRETVGARCPVDRRIRVDGPAGMSAGILMSAGLLQVEGSSGRNTGVLLRGGRVAVQGDCGDFTGTEMRSGEIFVKGSAGSFACARMKGGSVYARGGKPVPPARESRVSPEEQRTLAKALGLNPLHAMMYRKFSL